MNIHTATGEINISQLISPQDLAEVIAKIPLQEIEQGEDYCCVRLRKMTSSHVEDDKLKFDVVFETEGPDYCFKNADAWARLHWHELNALPQVKMEEIYETERSPQALAPSLPESLDESSERSLDKIS